MYRVINVRLFIYKHLRTDGRVRVSDSPLSLSPSLLCSPLPPPPVYKAAILLSPVEKTGDAAAGTMVTKDEETDSVASISIFSW